MNVLRDRLRQSSPKLYEALEKSWEVAWENWFPAITPQKDSFNSYPHIRNAEMYLNKFVQVYEAKTGKINGLFSDLETYVILSSILLHDIGRSIPSGFHWEESQKLIEEHWPLLGIPCYELAHSIGKICAAHDFRRPEQKAFNLDSLTTITVDPYGIIKEREMGALLILCDHLDTSVNRVIADFLMEKDRESVGAFRSKIRGVDIDFNGGLIKIVLGEKWGDKSDNKYRYSRKQLQQVEITLNKDCFELNSENPAKVKNSLEPYLAKTIPNTIREFIKTINLNVEKDKFPVDDSSIGKLLKSVPEPIKFGTIYKNIWSKYKPTVIDLLLACQCLYANKDKEKPDYVDSFKKAALKEENEKSFRDGFKSLKTISPELQFLIRIFAERWVNRSDGSSYDKKSIPAIPKPLILSMLLGNTRENVESLISITETLQSMGLPILGWCVEYKGHLYNFCGEETYEPIFSRDFLSATLKSMWELSTQIFGANKLSFEALASHLREPNIVKVKRAVRRLNVITQRESSESQAFWISDEYWRWKVKNRRVETTQEKSQSRMHPATMDDSGCKFYRKKDIEEYLKKLGDPNGGLK
jgi:hypothetical protein